MDRRDANYYEAHAQTINLEEITSDEYNAAILQGLRDNDLSFTTLEIKTDCDDASDDDFFIDEEDDLGWLGYFVGNSDKLESLWIHASPETIGVNRFGDFIEGLNRNQSIETLNIWTDLGSASFRQFGDFFRNNNNLRELIFGGMDTINSIGVESARGIAFMLSQPEQSNLRKICFEQSDFSEEVLTEIVTAISTHSQLEELNLGENNLGRKGSVALGEALKACNNPRLQNLILWNNSIDDEGLRALVAGMRNCHSLTDLRLYDNTLITVDGFRSLSTLFQSDCCQLKYLDLDSMNMGDDGARVIAAGLVNLRSLEKLYLGNNSIGDDGMSALASGLANLHLLKDLRLGHNSIGDLGLQALVEGLVNCVNLKDLHLSGNRMIAASGLGSLSTLIQSEGCSLSSIWLPGIPFGDDGAAALAAALKGNKSMKDLYFNPESAKVTSVGWSAFSRLLCDTSSVNTTYLTNHHINEIGRWDNGSAASGVKQLLALSKNPAEHVAIHKILKSHSDFDIEPFFEWKLKLLPLLVSWFDRVRNLVDDHKWISDESMEEIQSRQLSVMYNFVRGMPLVAIDGYRSRNNNTAVLAPSRKRKIEQLHVDES